jgi:hypothetical protein
MSQKKTGAPLSERTPPKGKFPPSDDQLAIYVHYGRKSLQGLFYATLNEVNGHEIFATHREYLRIEWWWAQWRAKIPPPEEWTQKFSSLKPVLQTLPIPLPTHTPRAVWEVPRRANHRYQNAGPNVCINIKQDGMYWNSDAVQSNKFLPSVTLQVWLHYTFINDMIVC